MRSLKVTESVCEVYSCSLVGFYRVVCVPIKSQFKSHICSYMVTVCLPLTSCRTRFESKSNRHCNCRISGEFFSCIPAVTAAENAQAGGDSGCRGPSSSDGVHKALSNGRHDSHPCNASRYRHVDETLLHAAFVHAVRQQDFGNYSRSLRKLVTTLRAG